MSQGKTIVATRLLPFLWVKIQVLRNALHSVYENALAFLGFVAAASHRVSSERLWLEPLLES